MQTTIHPTDNMLNINLYRYYIYAKCNYISKLHLSPTYIEKQCFELQRFWNYFGVWLKCPNTKKCTFPNLFLCSNLKKFQKLCFENCVPPRWAEFNFGHFISETSQALTLTYLWFAESKLFSNFVLRNVKCMNVKLVCRVETCDLGKSAWLVTHTNKTA